MKINIQTPHLDINKELEEYVHYKVGELSPLHQKIEGATVYLKVNNSSDKENSICEIKLAIPGNDLFVERKANTFYNAITLAVVVLENQLKKTKFDLKSTQSIIAEDKYTYPSNEDIYNKSIEESEINPEDITKMKFSEKNNEGFNEKEFENNMTGDDLDIPGNEDDETEENFGKEDEENNYYSLGGDNHNDLEENNNK